MQEDDFDVQLLYKYLGDPTTKIQIFNECDWAVLQEKIEELKKAINDIKEVDKLLSDMSNN